MADIITFDDLLYARAALNAIRKLIEDECEESKEWINHPRLNFMEYVSYDNIFTISTFLNIPDILNLMKVDTSCYILFATDRFWKYIDFQQYNIPKKCPFLSVEFISNNYDTLKEINNACHLNKIHHLIETNVVSQMMSIENEKREGMFDSERNLSDSIDQIKEMYLKKFQDLMDMISNKKIIKRTKCISKITSGIGRNINQQNEANTEYIRKFASKYEKMKTMNFLTKKYLKSTMLEYVKQNKEHEQQEIYTPCTKIKEGVELIKCIGLEYLNGFIEKHKGCHIVIPHTSHTIPTTFDDIYVFNPKKKDKNKYTLLHAFFDMTNRIVIYENRKTFSKYCSRLTNDVLRNYDIDDMTMEAQHSEN